MQTQSKYFQYTFQSFAYWIFSSCVVESVVIMPKAKRSKSLQPKLKSLSLFYNKVCELVSLLGDLVDIQSLTDTDILQVCVISHFAVQFVTYM